LFSVSAHNFDGMTDVKILYNVGRYVISLYFLGPKQGPHFGNIHVTPTIKHLGGSDESCRVFWKRFARTSWLFLKYFHQMLWIPSVTGVFKFWVFRMACLTSSRVILTGGISGSSAQLFTSSAIQYASSECYRPDARPKRGHTGGR
jgi:hypothetical protein